MNEGEAQAQRGHLQRAKWNESRPDFISIGPGRASSIIMWTPDWGEDKQERAAPLPLLLDLIHHYRGRNTGVRLHRPLLLQG